MSEDATEADTIEVVKFDGTSPYVAESRDIFLDIAKFFPVEAGKAISKKEREDLNLKQTTLVYGEIGFDSFGISFLMTRTIRHLYHNFSPRSTRIRKD